MYAWIVLLHILGAFAFAFGHGTSMVVAFRLRGARDAGRIRELLGVSQAGTGVMYIGLVVLLAAGVAAGFIGGHWSRLWIWAALAILVATAIVMYAVASPHYARLRAAAGVPGYAEHAAKFEPPADPGQLPALVGSRKPLALAGVGGSALVAILYLMVFKPF